MRSLFRSLFLRKQPRTFRRSRAPVMARLDGAFDDFRRVDDIGRGGFRLATRVPLKPGHVVPVRLQFPDLWEEVALDAEVRWAHRSGRVGFFLSEEHRDPDDALLLEIMIAHQEHLGRMALLC